MKKLVLTITLVLTGVVAAPASGAITYVSQARSVSADGFVNGQFDGGPTYMANDFGVFNRTTSWTFSNGTGVGLGSQLSRLQSTSIIVDAASHLTLTGQPSISASASSIFDVTFNLTADTDFMLQQTHSSSGVSFGTRMVRSSLSGPGGVVWSWNHDLIGNSWPTGSISGFLPAGQYRLQLVCFVGLGTSISDHHGSASLLFTIPTPHTSVGFAMLTCGYFGRRRRCGGSTGAVRS